MASLTKYLVPFAALLPAIDGIAQSTGNVYVPLAARCRVADSRVISSPIGAAVPRSLDVTNNVSYASQGGSGSSTSCGIPANATAYSVSLTIIPTGAAGFFKVFPTGGVWQDGNTVNFSSNVNITNDVIVRSGSPTNELDVYSSASTNYVVDIVGYFTSSALDCTNTTVSTFTISANSVDFFNNPSCPSGYRPTTPYCWTGATGVYSQGSGFNANNPSGATFCSWQNTTGVNKTVFGGNVCCRVP